MIKSETFTIDWVRQVNQEKGWRRKDDQFINFEKAIMALKLLESLKLNNIEFIFKGGTSLLLLLDKLYRFSVDIDIIIENTEKYIDKFDGICSDIFTHWDEQIRNVDGNSRIKHYRFYYKPFVDNKEERYILLDVCEEKSLYLETQKISLRSPLLKTDDKDIYVTVPTIDCILADKLTAFAPHTIGIKLSAEPDKRPKRVEILKQMFDIANLFDRCKDIKVIKDTYIKIAQSEIEMASLQCDYKETLKDSFEFALMIGFDGKKQKEEFAVLSKGYNEFSKFIVDLSFDKWKAILCASKVAYLIICILQNSSIEKYSDDINLMKMSIKNKDYKDFESYLYSSPESYYYFTKAINDID